MITEKQYLDAIKTVKEYHQQINSIINEIPKLNVRTCKKVKCINTYAGGHDLYFLTIGKVAEIIGVSKSTLRYWEDNGKIKSTRCDTNNYRLYNIDEINNFIKSNNLQDFYYENKTREFKENAQK